MKKKENIRNIWDFFMNVLFIYGMYVYMHMYV